MTPISTALLAERTKRGWNQRRAAQFLGTSQPQYQKWESGENEPGGHYYPAIFTFLGLDEHEAAVLVLRDRLARQNVPLDAARDWRAHLSQGSE